jgi:hypothetical protein
MGGRVKSIVALSFVFAAAACPSAFASSPKSVASQASALARSPGAGVLSSALDTEAGYAPAAELSRFLLSGGGPSLTPHDRGLARLTLVLLSPRVREAVNSLDSPKPPTGTQLAVLRRVLVAVTRNPAIKRLKAEGERLRRRPAQLRRAISTFVKETDRGSGVIPVASSSPFAKIDDAVLDPALGVRGESLASALRRLLSSPGAARYLQSWPPFALSAFASARTTTSDRPAVASSSAGGEPDPGCTAAEAEAGIAVDAYVGKTLTDHLIDELRNEVLTKAGEVAAKNVVSLGKLVALAKRNFGRLVSRANVALDAKDILDAAIGLGKLGYEAAYRAAVHCYAARVELVPGKATRVAGEGQLFNLLAYNAKGRQIAAVPPDSMRIGNGECREGNPDWECFGEKAGADPVLASFGDLVASGELAVKPGPLHSLKLSPNSSQVGVGEPSARFAIVGKDRFGNELPVSIGPLSDEAHLSIAPEGKCEDLTATCVAQAPGPHTITAKAGNTSGEATLEVEGEGEKEGEGGPLSAIQWSGTITIANHYWSSDGSSGRHSEGTETAVFQIDENVLDGSTGLDPEKGTRHFFVYSYQIDVAESGGGPDPCESWSGEFSAHGKAGGTYSEPGGSGFYMGFEVFPDDYSFMLFPIWVSGTIIEGCPLFSFEFGRQFDQPCGEELVGHPLPRNGVQVVDSLHCSEGEEGAWGRDGSIDLDLTATCFSGDVPDENWECPGVKP